MFLSQQLYIADTHDKGLGVFSRQPLAEGTVIEESPVLVMSDTQRYHLDQTLLHDYIFEWEPGNKKMCCMALGYVPIYNHSDHANCEHFMNYKKETIIIRTMRDIEADEELTINYTGEWNSKAPVWFETSDE